MKHSPVACLLSFLFSMDIVSRSLRISWMLLFWSKSHLAMYLDTLLNSSLENYLVIQMYYIAHKIKFETLFFIIRKNKQQHISCLFLETHNPVKPHFSFLFLIRSVLNSNSRHPEPDSILTGIILKHINAPQDSQTNFFDSLVLLPSRKKARLHEKTYKRSHIHVNVE